MARRTTDRWTYLETAPDGTEFRITKHEDCFGGTCWDVFKGDDIDATHTFNLKREAIEWINS